MRATPAGNPGAPPLPTGREEPGAPAARAVLLAALLAAAGGAVAAFLVATAATASGAPADAQQLQPGAYLVLSVVAAVVGAVGWALVVRRAAHPRRLLRRLVLVVFLVLLVPDVLIASSGQATWGTAASLMVMHLAVAAVVVGVYHRLMPPRVHADGS